MFGRLKRFFGKQNSTSKRLQGLKSDEMPFEIRMKKLEKYFRIHSENDESFQPEFDAARRINQIILKDKFSQNHILKIVEIFNETNSKPHYNGSGWLDLRLQLQSLIRGNGMESKIAKNGNIEIVETRKTLPGDTYL